MSGETNITVVGRLVDDPSLRFTPSGSAVANFNIATNARTFNKQSQEWEDQPPMFLGCSVWRQYAENVAESLTKGMQVILTGRLKSRSYETREGEKRTVFEVDVDEVGPALRYATAQVTRTQSSGGGGNSRPSGGGGGTQDPWARAGAGTAGSDPWGGGQPEEPPFAVDPWEPSL